MQSLGYASMEKLENRKGYFRQSSMSDYVIPTSMDFPKQEYHIQENPYEWGPFGAKGMGELVFNGASAPYVDAVERALGITVRSIPITPEDIEEALKNVR
jgi:CO/xanthine dehydrogenase Mo-binding subunit